MSSPTAFRESALLQMRASFSRNVFRFCLILQPVLYGTMLFLMFRGRPAEEFATHAVLGNGLLALWSTVVFSSASDIDRERRSGTLEVLSIVPSDFRLIMAGRIAGNTVLGLFILAGSAVFAALAFGRTFPVASFLIFTAAMLLTLASYTCTAMLLAPLFYMSRNVRGLLNTMEFPVYILAGIVFPIEILPVWTRPLSWILAPTWAVRLLRTAMMGTEPLSKFREEAGILCLLSAAYLGASLLLFKRIDRRVRIAATLGAY